jgi:hypothetical protein
MIDPTGKIQMVHYKICSLVEGKNKILNPKLDGLQKHASKRKTLIPHPGVLVSDYYINNDSQHQWNERVHATQGLDSITNLVVNGGKIEKKKKLSNLWQSSIC